MCIKFPIPCSHIEQLKLFSILRGYTGHLDKVHNPKTRLSRSPATLYGPRHISAFMPRQQPKSIKLKYCVTLTCSHGGVKVKIMYLLQIYIVHSIDWYQHWRNRFISFGEANTNYYPSKIKIHTKSKYIVTLTCSHGGVKVKMKYMLQIYIVPSVDWHQHWRIWSSSFGGEARTQTTVYLRVLVDLMYKSNFILS